MAELTFRLQVDGKFLRLGNERFYIKGATYGTFKPDNFGCQFPSSEIIEKDFKMMSEKGINSIRTYTVPSISLLDLAWKYNLKVMIGLPWEQHLTFLENKITSSSIIDKLRKSVNNCKMHPAILCYAIGNEIPATIVRWYGERKVTNFIKKLYNIVKQIDSQALVTYVNYPTTEYLHLPFLDFYCYNVYLETKEKFATYLLRLHNLIGDKPLVLAEIGLDSLRNGIDKQALVLNWQMRTIFEKGCAGAFTFSWTDEWWRGGLAIEDWAFGLVDSKRNPKPALFAIQKVYKEAPFTSEIKLPRISVVICSYNGSRTIRDTIEGCLTLDYPDFEIIVVNDGSTDSTPMIAGQYPVKLINTVNKGLSSARNTGIYESNGEIIAYIDDDAYPDREWLRYLASLYLNSDYAAIGGPNIAPYKDQLIADGVAYAPGRPAHVLKTDELAEHIPGCNMSFRREALMKIGGFDPVFRSAGDDVDLCWRLQNVGYKIGFHPSAFVWHHCRNSLKMYWRQQKGYGKAEALLSKKWPEKYNGLGHLTWTGYIYGIGLTHVFKEGTKKIFYGKQGTALFQSVYKPATGIYKSLPLMPEWNLLIIFLGIISLLSIEWRVMIGAVPLFILSGLIILIQAAGSASHAVRDYKPKSKFSCNSSKIRIIRMLGFWTITALLHIFQPVARLIGRINNGLSLWKCDFKNLKYFTKFPFSPRIITHWSESWRPAQEWLATIQNGMRSLNNQIQPGGEFDRWDLKSKAGLFSSVKSLLTIEEYGMGKQMLKLKSRAGISGFGVIIITASGLLSFFALKANAYISFAFFLLVVVFPCLNIICDLSGFMRSLQLVMKNLPEGLYNESAHQPFSTSQKVNHSSLPCELRFDPGIKIKNYLASQYKVTEDEPVNKN